MNFGLIKKTGIYAFCDIKLVNSYKKMLKPDKNYFFRKLDII